MTENSPLTSGHKLEGKYRITRMLSQDPLSYTYHGVQMFSGDELIIKQARHQAEEEAAHKSTRSALEREFELIKKLEHPSVPLALDFFYVGEVDFLTRQFRVGKPLTEIVGFGLDLERVRDISGQILGALDEIHRKGFIYLGLSPKSVLVNEKNQVSLIHFTFARAMGERVDSEEARLFDSDYMAPEVSEYESVSSRADIFSFGALLFYMLTGKSISVLESARDIQSYNLGSELSQTIVNCIYTEPEDRYPGVKKLREDLFAYEALDMPSFALSDPGEFTGIGQIRGGFHNEEMDRDHQGRIIKVLLVVMVMAAIMIPLVPGLLAVLSGLIVLACLVAVVVVKNTSFYLYEMGEMGFSIKGPGFEKAYSWSQVVKFTWRRGGFRVTVHLVNGNKLYFRTEDLESIVELLKRISGKPVIEIDRFYRKNVFHDEKVQTKEEDYDF